jgi:hypothetical protein
VALPAGEIFRFLGRTICRVLDLENHVALRRLDEDEKSTLVIGNGNRSYRVNTINESGLYSLILTSRKPQAVSFRKWVTSEVLPALRKTGRHEAPGVPPAIAMHRRRRKGWWPLAPTRPIPFPRPDCGPIAAPDYKSKRSFTFPGSPGKNERGVGGERIRPPEAPRRDPPSGSGGRPGDHLALPATG